MSDTSIATTRPQGIISGEARSALAIVPTSFSEIVGISKVLVASRLTPFDSADQVALVILDALERGKPMVQHLQSRYVIHGRVGIYADAMVADVIASGLARYIRPVDVSDTRAVWETVRADWPEDARPARFSFTIAEAKQAGLLSNPKYGQMPQRMLSARAKSYLCRDIYPDVMAGVVSVEELEDEAAVTRTPSSSSRRTPPRTVEATVEPEEAEGVTDALVSESEQDDGLEPEPPHDEETGEIVEAVSQQGSPLVEHVRAVGRTIDEARETVEEDASLWSDAQDHLRSVVPRITRLKDDYGLDAATVATLRDGYAEAAALITQARRDTEAAAPEAEEE